MRGEFTASPLRVDFEFNCKYDRTCVRGESILSFSYTCEAICFYFTRIGTVHDTRGELTVHSRLTASTHTRAR